MYYIKEGRSSAVREQFCSGRIILVSHLPEFNHYLFTLLCLFLDINDYLIRIPVMSILITILFVHIPVPVTLKLFFLLPFQYIVDNNAHAFQLCKGFLFISHCKIRYSVCRNLKTNEYYIQ